MATPSLSEFIAQSQRGLYQSVFGPGMLKKDSFSEGGGTAFSTTATGDTTGGRSIFTETYGRKVWQALNNQTRFFNAIPRVVWGNTAGWRVRTNRGENRSNPISEAGALPTVDVSNIEPISSLPRIVGTTFGASVRSVFTAQLEGGIGDVLAMENENAQLDHMKELNQEMLSLSVINAAATGNATTFNVTNANAKHIHPGDIYTIRDATNGQFMANATVHTTNGVGVADSGGAGNTLITLTGSSTQPVDAGDNLFAVARNGITSIDDIVEQDMVLGSPAGAGRNPSAITNAIIGSGVNIGSKVYDNLGGRDATSPTRAPGSWAAAAHVDDNGGIARDLSLNMIDTCIQKIRENGGEPKVIIMGHDQYFKLERLLNSQQRYMGQEEYQVGVGSERTFPGTKTGLILATYMGIPILPDADVAKSSNSAGSGSNGSNIYVLDTDYIEMAVAQPTQYIENRDYFAANQLVIRGLLYTMGELRCRNFFVQAKITDLSA